MSPAPGILSQPIERDEAAWNQGLAAYHPSLGTVLDTTVADTLTRSPTPTAFRGTERYLAGPRTVTDEAGDAYELPGEDMLAAQDANEQYGIPGHLKFDGPTPSSVASQLHDLKRAELAREDVMQRSPGGLLQGAAELGTGLVSSALDPLNVAAGFIPVVGEARMATWLARAGEGVAARAAVRTGAGAINAGVSQVPLVAATYGGAQAEQADYGAVDALVSLAMGTALGGGLHASIGALTDRFSRTAGIGERLAAAPPETREAALRSAVGQLAGDGQVQGIDAVLSAEGARVGRPITGDLARPFSGPDNEASAIHEFDPAELGTDAATFQFKAGGDEEGVTDRLAGVTQWDPVKAGLSIVYEDANGKRWIADGHQRLGLANRLADEYPEQPRPKLYGWLYRAADGVSPEEVRVIAAAKNIAEGTGSAVDAAKVLRDAPGLAKELPPRSELVRQARALTNLDDRAFGMVVNGLVPTQYAAIVGRLAPEGGLEQRALLDLLAKTQPENATEAEAIVRQGLAAGHVESRQMGLFGEETIATNLFLDRARVLDRAMKDLRSDKKLFAAIAREKTKLAAEGAAKVNKQASERKAEIDAQALQSIQTLATRTGALSDSLTAAARRGREERNYAAATRDFVAAIRAAVARGDFDGLAASGDRGGAVVADEGAGGAQPARRAGDVATPAARSSAAEASGKASSLAGDTSTERQAPSRQASTVAPPEGVFAKRTMEPSQERGAKNASETIQKSSYHATNDIGRIKALAKAAEPDLRRLLDWATAGIDGAKAYGARLKGAAEIQSKLDIGKRPDQISDVLGGRIVVDNWAALDQVLDRLDRGARIIQRDDFLEQGKGGYRAVHLQIYAPDRGISAELQIQPREIREVQDQAHQLYAKFRRRPLSAAEATEAEAATAHVREMFDDAWEAWLVRNGERDEPREPPPPAGPDENPSPQGGELPNGSEERAAAGGAASKAADSAEAPAADRVAGEAETSPAAADLEGDLFRNNPYPSDDETTAALTRAAAKTKGTADQRLDAVLAGAEHDLARLKAEGLVDAAAAPELAAADHATERAGVLERVYEAGAACLTRNA